MANPLKTLTAVAFSLALAFPAIAQDEMTADTVIASVNGQEITLGHMLIARAALPEEYQKMEPSKLWDGLLNQLVQQEVLRQDDLAVESKRVKKALENERRSLLASEVIAKVIQEEVSEEAIKTAYDEAFGEIEPDPEFNASHILVETEEQAQAIVDELNGGADFAETARAKSTGPSGPNGGKLGWFAAGMMVQEFQDAVEKLKVGGISAPVKTQFGWHVIILNEKRDQAVPTLDETRANISADLQRRAAKEYLDAAVENAEVVMNSSADIDTSVLFNLELLEE